MFTYLHFLCSNIELYFPFYKWSFNVNFDPFPFKTFSKWQEKEKNHSNANVTTCNDLYSTFVSLYFLLPQGLQKENFMAFVRKITHVDSITSSQYYLGISQMDFLHNPYLRRRIIL